MIQHLSPEGIEIVAARFRVLSEGIRLRLVDRLRDGEKTVTELTTEMGTSQPNVSKHLKILSESGILRREQRGNSVFYSIADESIFMLCEVVCDSLSSRLAGQASLFVLAKEKI
jgi:ArsR family transcriptional regulator